MMADNTSIRPATAEDLDALVGLEQRGFRSDRFSRDQLNYLVTRARATALVLEFNGTVAGAAIMLWRRGLTIGRIYNIVIDPQYHGKRFGARLLEVCELEAIRRGCTEASLEVRLDNKQAIGFYEKHGYRIDETIEDYYSDGTSALRMLKTLTPVRPKQLKLKIPYYAQTQEFTCGPACLMMAFKYFNSEATIGRKLELVLWKEATLVFMTSGIGGTGPFGLALAAQRRGFPTRVVLSRQQTPFFSSVRSDEKRRVIRLVHEDSRAKALALGVTADYYDFTFNEIAGELAQGRIPIVLISTYHLHGDHAPHWVAVTGFDEKYVYFHDPYEKFYEDEVHLARNVRIPIDQFSRMRRYGRDLYKSVIFVGPQTLKAQVSIDGRDL